MGSKDCKFESYLSRINRLNPSLKAFIALKDPAALRRDLQDLQAEGAGIDLPLRGVPVAVKDMIDVRGFPTTGGTIYKRWPEEDAAVIKKMKAAGAIIPGKTNMHELAHGITGENPHYGSVPNPLNQNYMAGGSSSGSAAAVAAGLVPIALGSDTAGSVRIPAAFCGIYGFKPARGRISMQGCMPLSQSLTIGLLSSGEFGMNGICRRLSIDVSLISICFFKQSTFPLPVLVFSIWIRGFL